MSHLHVYRTVYGIHKPDKERFMSITDKVRYICITDKVRYTRNTDFVYNGQKTLVPTGTLYARFTVVPTLCTMEGNILLNDALNTFYLWLYGIGYMVRDHSYCARGNLWLPLQGLLFLISSSGSFIDRIAHNMAFVVEHWWNKK